MEHLYTHSSLRLQDAAEQYAEKLRNPPSAEELGVPTPFQITLGTMRPGRLHVLAGYPADGKTAISLQFVRTAAEAGKRVDFFSIEMTAEELMERIVSAYGVPYTQAQSGQILEPYRPNAERALYEAASWDVEIHDDPDLTPDRMEDIAGERKSDLMVVDHLHALGHRDRFEVEANTRALKAAAKRLRIPCLTLAHLSRAPRKAGHTAFPRPDMARLRESGMIEAWADTVWFVWRYRDERDLPVDAGELIVAKSRFNDTGWAGVTFEKRFQRWITPEFA